MTKKSFKERLKGRRESSNVIDLRQPGMKDRISDMIRADVEELPERLPPGPPRRIQEKKKEETPIKGLQEGKPAKMDAIQVTPGKWKTKSKS